MNESAVSTLGVDALNWPAQGAGPCSPSLVSEHGSTAGDLFSCVEVPEEKLIGSASRL